MKIYIHHRVGSFSDRWIEYCSNNELDYEIIDALNNDSIKKIKKGDFFLWHWHHNVSEEVLVARYIISSLERIGVFVYPDTSTSETFDNKVAQKYQLESLGLPLVNTYVFYRKKDAMSWVRNQKWPKVFKLSRGSASRNVSLIKSEKEACAIIKKCFGSGFRPIGGHVKENIGRLKVSASRKGVDWLAKLKRLPRTVIKIYMENRRLGLDVGYAYFQDFVAGKSFDIRVVVIGGRCYGSYRYVREGDFRASGSGNVDVDKVIPLECVELAFKAAKEIKTQTLALDLIETELGYKIIEASYGFAERAVSLCPGYWNENLKWTSEKSKAEYLIIENLIKESDLISEM